MTAAICILIAACLTLVVCLVARVIAAAIENAQDAKHARECDAHEAEMARIRQARQQ
jgi:hypothetical protein